MRISVIIPCRNEKRYIGEFLDSLAAQEFDPTWQIEILIADGMSDDGTRDVVRQHAERFSQVRILDNPGLIVSTGLNAAIEASKGDIIIRMDMHTTYARDYIRQCVFVLRESGADNVGGPVVARGRGLMGKAIATAYRFPFCTGGGKSHNPDYEGEIDTVAFGCWHRSVFDRVGLFDSTLVRNQDDEFNFRLLRAGGRIWQSPRIRSSYITRTSITALFQQYLQYGFWKVAVIRKHRSLASWRHAVPALFIGATLLSLALVAIAAALGLSRVAVGISNILAAEMSVYLLICVVSTFPYVATIEPRVLLLLPAVIVVYHVAYGLGFLAGLVRLARYRSRHVRPLRLFTTLTR